MLIRLHQGDIVLDANSVSILIKIVCILFYFQTPFWLIFESNLLKISNASDPNTVTLELVKTPFFTAYKNSNIPP